MIPVFSAVVGRVLSPTSGFLREAGFTHSLTPARNCTFGCAYCYVPTMGVYGGLKRDDWERWGQHTTYKSNAAALLAKELRPDQVIYCSPLVDPYQPAEADVARMPDVLDALLARPPRVFVLQTRGPLILRDLDRVCALAKRTTVRVSFSVTTDDEQVRRWYEPHCAPFSERLHVLRQLRAAGIPAYATLAPLLPCDPEALAAAAWSATGRELIGDPLHVRAVKRTGATTREAAWRIAQVRGHKDWFAPDFQEEIVQRIRRCGEQMGFEFATGPHGFGRLARDGREP